jgi:hypothetical protein
MPITRTFTPATTGRVKFATSTAPRPPLADLVSNPIPTRTTRARKDVVGCRAEAEQRRTNRRWLGRAPQTQPEFSRCRLSPESRDAARNYFTFSTTSISTGSRLETSSKPSWSSKACFNPSGLVFPQFTCFHFKLISKLLVSPVC